ncbi:histamine H2 receptor-like [Exaiptasia diaphana]|uniref:G-protein coupled receptors family 1 profile domain-containing protein n=1 Tax=Exaiptasia diaphana TaxID=2652724 RepID=A0A913YXX8_EXADI|nr:histamine H2 receptor-like [Exaiptasia diaphana]
MTDRPDSVDPTWNFLSVVNGVASPPTVVINALIIWAVLGNEDLRSSCFNILLAALAVTDFLVGLLVAPIFCFYLRCLVGNIHSPCTSTVYILSSLILCGLTHFTLTLVSFERYLAIEHPNFYLKMVTARRVMLGTMIYWAGSITPMVIVFIFSINSNQGMFKVPHLVFIGFSTLVILYCSIKVQVTAYRQRRAIALQQESVLQPDEQQRQQERLKEYRRVFMTSILVIASILFYVPVVVVTVIQAIEGSDVTDDFKYISAPICATFLHLQSLINPILVSLRLSYIRTSIKNKLATVFNWN